MENSTRPVIRPAARAGGAETPSTCLTGDGDRGSAPGIPGNQRRGVDCAEEPKRGVQAAAAASASVGAAALELGGRYTRGSTESRVRGICGRGDIIGSVVALVGSAVFLVSSFGTAAYRADDGA
eukprot:4981787-Prymnesium_polylepis.1